MQIQVEKYIEPTISLLYKNDAYFKSDKIFYKECLLNIKIYNQIYIYIISITSNLELLFMQLNLNKQFLI